MNGGNVKYCDSFGTEYILEEIKKFIGNKNIRTNIRRIQENDSIIYGYFGITLINFMLKSKSLLNKLFSPNKYEKNDKVTLDYFQ